MNELSPKDVFANEDEQNTDIYPELYNLSAAFMYRFMARPVKRARPEFLYLPIKKYKGRGSKYLELTALIGEWNLGWEQAQLRSETIYYKEIWEGARKSLPHRELLEGRNVYLLPDTAKRFDAYQPLYAMLPASVLARFGLPPIRRMTWPTISTHDIHRVEPWLPADFRDRLSRAFASHVWPLIRGGSPLNAFSKNEPIKLLAHNLDFWLPHAVRVAEDRLSELPLVELENEKDKIDLASIQESVPKDEGSVDRCRMGGHIWLGEAEAAEAAAQMVCIADKGAELSALVEAIRSNRVEEDFSDRWSFAREDFERKLYRKRSKVRVKFVD